MGLAEQVLFGKGKCLEQAVQKFESLRGFVKEEVLVFWGRLWLQFCWHSESSIIIIIIIIIIKPNLRASLYIQIQKSSNPQCMVDSQEVFGRTGNEKCLVSETVLF